MRKFVSNIFKNSFMHATRCTENQNSFHSTCRFLVKCCAHALQLSIRCQRTRQFTEHQRACSDIKTIQNEIAVSFLIFFLFVVCCLFACSLNNWNGCARIIRSFSFLCFLSCVSVTAEWLLRQRNDIYRCVGAVKQWNDAHHKWNFIKRSSTAHTRDLRSFIFLFFFFALSFVRSFSFLLRFVSSFIFAHFVVFFFAHSWNVCASISKRNDWYAPILVFYCKIYDARCQHLFTIDVKRYP